MWVHTITKGNQIIKELEQFWPSGLISQKYTRSSYDQLLRTVLQNFRFEVDQEVLEVKRSMFSLPQIESGQKQEPAQRIMHAGFQPKGRRRSLKIQRAAFQLAKRRLGLKDNLKQMKLSTSQMESARRFLNSFADGNIRNKLRPRGRQPKITAGHIEAVSAIVKKFGNTRFTSKLIKHQLDSNWPDLTQISTATVAKILREHLHYRWRKVGGRAPGVLTKDYQIDKADMARIILALLHLRFHIVWVDEFSTNDKSYSHYMWQHRLDEKPFVTGDRVGSWTTIAAMSSSGFKYVQSKQGTNSSEDFVYFLTSMIGKFKEQFPGELEKLVIFCDGAALHYATITRDWLVMSGIRMLMNCRYTPEYNACELFIRAIKMKLRTRCSHVRPVNQGIIEEAANEVRTDSLQFYEDDVEARAAKTIEDRLI